MIVAAAGPQTKWGGHLGVRSHFAPVREELGSDAAMPLLGRTLWQAARWSDEVCLVGPPDDPEPYRELAAMREVHFYVASAGRRNEFESTRPVWAPGGTNVLLLGDVWFTDVALATVLAHAGEGFRFFGREQASPVTGSPWGEIFAQSWTDTAEMGRLTEAVRREQDAGHADPTKHGWTMLRLLQDTPLREHVVLRPWWVEINDATDDIDFPEDYSRHPATRGLMEAAACE
ncbi:hypothetical protein [Streptomyces sp.]|uniref:hypothetical protein n=1 Tax=Streptomyces sp. TaxID=1931 RepID=UPI002F950F98